MFTVFKNTAFSNKKRTFLHWIWFDMQSPNADFALTLIVDLKWKIKHEKIYFIGNQYIILTKHE